tara:strand:- start:164 stop:790 length:627 start_codon:yes stop_codon:yes gene_type:complete
MHKFFIKSVSTIYLLFNSPFIYSDQIYDLSVDGISVGDSLLEFMNEKKIIEEQDKTKTHYSYLVDPLKYSEVYIRKDFPVYDLISVFYKRKNKNKYFTIKNQYEIEMVRGQISFIEDFDGCLKKKNEVKNELISMFPFTQKKEDSFSHSLDPTGRSIVHSTKFSFDSGNSIVLQCNDWEEYFRSENKFTEGFKFVILKKEVDEWLSNY